LPLVPITPESDIRIDGLIAFIPGFEALAISMLQKAQDLGAIAVIFGSSYGNKLILSTILTMIH